MSKTPMRVTRRVAAGACLLLAWAAACARSGEPSPADLDLYVDAGAGERQPDGGGFGGSCNERCAPDKRSILSDCAEAPLACEATQECVDAKCVDGCAAAEADHASVGCDYYAVKMDVYPNPYFTGGCFAAFLANTYSAPAHLSATYGEGQIDFGKHARIPVGDGEDITYEPYDPVGGLPPGEVAILFLAESSQGGVRCPAPAARSSAALTGSGYGTAFRIQSTVPIVAYQMMPYGGGAAAVTGASLLLPTSVWGTNYVAVNAGPATAQSNRPSLNIVAAEDATTITILPTVDIEGSDGNVKGGPAGVPIEYTLDRGEHLQLTQRHELTGSIISSDKKVGVLGGHQCLNLPSDHDFCDHAEQQLPPVNALGHEYVAVPHRPRTSAPDPAYWRIVGAVDGTELSFDPPIEGGPPSVGKGEYADFVTDGPFVVKSQGDEHPFMLFAYMTGTGDREGYGDPDFVRVVPPSQYLKRYVFFTDPTYPETNLVVVRKRTEEAGFESVTLDCAGELGGWQPLGADYEYTRTDLVRHDFEPQGGCNNGLRVMESSDAFGLTVWGWGSPETSGGTCGALGFSTCYVSYGYPAGEGVRPVNDVFIPPK